MGQFFLGQISQPPPLTQDSAEGNAKGADAWGHPEIVSVFAAFNLRLIIDEACNISIKRIFGGRSTRDAATRDQGTLGFPSILRRALTSAFNAAATKRKLRTFDVLRRPGCTSARMVFSDKPVNTLTSAKLIPDDSMAEWSARLISSSFPSASASIFALSRTNIPTAVWSTAGPGLPPLVFFAARVTSLREKIRGP